MAELKKKEIRQRLRELTDAELHQEITAQNASLYELRRRNLMRQLDNTTAIRDARKQIARVLTILRERELAGSGETE